MPSQMPSQLHMRTSKIQWSHQHSAKLGSWCCSEYSITSNMTDTIQQSQWSRRIKALAYQPNT